MGMRPMGQLGRMGASGMIWAKRANKAGRTRVRLIQVVAGQLGRYKRVNSRFWSVHGREVVWIWSQGVSQGKLELSWNGSKFKLWRVFFPNRLLRGKCSGCLGPT